MIETTGKNKSWTEGRTTRGGVTYKVSWTVADKPSQYGINGGKVIRLRVRPTNSSTFCIVYDHAWEIKPHTKVAEEIFKEIINLFN